MRISVKKLKKRAKNWNKRLFTYFSYKKLQKRKKNIQKNFGDFAKEEKREVKELTSGKQSLNRYFADSKLLFTDYFIPSEANNHHPKILRPRQLGWFAVVLIGVKVLLVSYLFIVYHQQAEMSATMINQLHVLTNETRLANDAVPLDLNSVLSQSAQIKAEDMVIHNYFAHTSPDGRRPWDFVNRNAYPYLLIGENLAMNFITASDVHTALMTSPSHRKNILNPKYTDIGLAVINGELNGQPTNILVQIFAHKKESPAAIAPEPTLAEIPAPMVSESTSTLATTSLTDILIAGEDINTPSAEQLVLVDAGPDYSETTSAETEEYLNILATEDMTSSGTEIIDPLDSEPDLIPVETMVKLEDNLNEGNIYAYSVENKPLNRASSLWYWSKIFYIFSLILLIITLLINIFVRLRIQHRSVIIQTLLLIVLIAALFLFDFSFIKEMNNASNILIF